MRFGALGAMALALGGLSDISLHPALGGSSSRFYRKDYKTAQARDGGASCQFPTHFPIADARKPRTNKNRNHREWRKAKIRGRKQNTRRQIREVL